MNNWYVILLAVVVILAITVLLYFALFDDEVSPVQRIRHTRGDYINDQTAVIVHSIKEIKDSAKAYQLFAEYIFTNHKQFLSFVEIGIRSIHDAYFSSRHDELRDDISRVNAMKVELKDQVQTQQECLDSIDPAYYIETAAWINIANNTRFDINKSMRRIAEVCLTYDENYTSRFPDDYSQLFKGMVDDICEICDESKQLIESADEAGMRSLRKRINVVMSKAYDDTSRLYALIHDGRNNIESDRKFELRYALNVIQESYCIIYSLRRLLLCDLCITASRKHQY